MVERVEHLPTKLKTATFADWEEAMNPKVNVEISWSYEDAAAGVAEVKLGRRHEGSQIEPTVNRTLGSRQVSIAKAIRPIAAPAG